MNFSIIFASTISNFDNVTFGEEHIYLKINIGFSRQVIHVVPPIVVDHITHDILSKNRSVLLILTHMLDDDMLKNFLYFI